MGQIYWPIDKRINGPWLLGKEALEDLDTLFEKISERLNSALNEEAELIEASNLKKNFIDGSLRNVSLQKSTLIISSDGKRLFDTTVKGLLRDEKINDITPKELNLNYRKGDNNAFELQISKTGDLSYKLYAYDEKIKFDIDYEVQKWIEKYKSKKIYQIWKSAGAGLATLTFFIILFSWLSLYDTINYSYKNVLLKQADSLLSKGITKDNETNAIDLILKIESNYSSKIIRQEKLLNKTARLVLIYSIFAFLLFVLHPTTIIGIGKSEFIFNITKIWIKFVTVIIFGAIFLPKIIEIAKEYLHL